MLFYEKNVIISEMWSIENNKYQWKNELTDAYIDKTVFQLFQRFNLYSYLLKVWSLVSSNMPLQVIGRTRGTLQGAKKNSSRKASTFRQVTTRRTWMNKRLEMYYTM